MSEYPPPGTSPGPAYGAPPPGYGPPPAYGPPPGYGPPPPPPGYGPGQPAYGPPFPGPPVHQPGVVPLRPLTLGDFFGGSTATIRRNPMATVGLAALVTFAFMLVPIVITIVVSLSGGLPSMRPFDSASAGSDNPAAGFGVNGATIGSGVFSWLAGIVVTGLVMRVVQGAVVGRRTSAGEAWDRGRGCLLRLLGLALLALVGGLLVVGVPAGLGALVGVLARNLALGIVLGVLGGLLGLVAAVFLAVRFLLLAAPNLVIEGNGVFASLARAGRLSQGQFWRLLGTSLLAGLAAALVGQVVAIPFAVFGVVGMFALPGSWGLASFLLTTYVASIITGAVTSPFTGGVRALQYYDQRFRKEGHDIELLNESLGRSPS